MVYLSRPGTADPQHAVSASVLADLLQRAHPGHPDAGALSATAARIRDHQRRYVAPPASEGLAGADPDAEVALGEQAARAALDAARLKAGDIGGFITISSAGEALCLRLIQALQLPSTVSYVPLADEGASGGLQALATAGDLARRGPVLIVQTSSGCAPEVPLARRLLRADGATAVVVRTDPPGPGEVALEVRDFWSWTESADAADVGGGASREFARPDEAADAVRTAIGRAPWLHRAHPGFALVHPGGPRYLDAVGEALDGIDLDGCRAVLASEGDTGSCAVLRVLARLFQEPPAPDSDGFLLGVAPEHSAACRAVWRRG
ncbi:hypothetical protein [Streptomyces sp. NBC_00470]|uniref:hypothetical protein n=1 Tax=Streptomyces sp. NBC_00470 TaxID=2975753 RepID=UPI002F917CE0